MLVTGVDKDSLDDDGAGICKADCVLVGGGTNVDSTATATGEFFADRKVFAVEHFHVSWHGHDCGRRVGSTCSATKSRRLPFCLVITVLPLLI